jgi:DNA-binding MarR family transcriptional regulator
MPKLESRNADPKNQDPKNQDPKNQDPKNQDPKNPDPKMPDPKSEPAGRFAYDGLDRVIHEKARLSVLTSLVAHPKGLVFGDLKQMCGLTDGNLSRHLQVLDEAGLIAIEKGYDHNRPQTVCRITAQGRRRYLDYLKVLEQVVQDAASAAKAGAGRGAAAVGQRRLKLA